MISDTPIAPSIPDVPTVSALIGCGCEGHHHCPCFYLRYKLQGVSSMNEAEKASKVMKCMLSKVRPTQNCSLFSPASQAFWVSVTLPMLIFFFSRVLSPPHLFCLTRAYSSGGWVEASPPLWSLPCLITTPCLSLVESTISFCPVSALLPLPLECLSQLIYLSHTNCRSWKCDGP